MPVTVLIALAAAACTTSHLDEVETVGTPPGTNESSNPDASAEDEFVSVVNRLSADDARFLLIAEQSLIARCMERRGLTYIEASIPAEPFSSEPRRYWGPDPASAAVSGYGIFEAQFAVEPQNPTPQVSDSASGFEGDVPMGQPTGDPHSDYLLSLSDDERRAWMEALMGTPESQITVRGEGEEGAAAFMNTDGCVGEVEEALYGDLAGVLEVDLLVAELRNERSQRVRADDRLQAAEEAWMRCMEAEGFEPGEPGDGYSIAREAYNTMTVEDAQQFELTVAVTDLNCVEASQVNEIFALLSAEADAHLEREHAGTLLGLAEFQASAVETAKQLLADGQ